MSYTSAIVNRDDFWLFSSPICVRREMPELWLRSASTVNAAIAATHPGRPAYGEQWVANKEGSARRARWLGELRRLGFMEAATRGGSRL